MISMAATIIICALLSILPAGIAYLVLHTRTNDILRRLDVIKHDDEALTHINNEMLKLFGECEKNANSINSVKESFQALSNKLASRSRTERKQERDEDEPRNNQNEIPFPDMPVMPQAAAQPAQPTQTYMRPRQFSIGGR